ncbi:MAG: Hsp20/alpha crystallin family protein [Granulosicoccus sp.]
MSTNPKFPVLLNVTVAETDNHCSVKADIKGFRAKNVRVIPWEDSLIVEMRTEDEPAHSYYLGELEPKSSKRVIPLGFEIKANSVMTHYQSGKLRISVAKRSSQVATTRSPSVSCA